MENIPNYMFLGKMNAILAIKKNFLHTIFCAYKNNKHLL